MKRPRRANRLSHLDASVQHVEDALNARAEALEERAKLQAIEELPWQQLASEFRALAEELHYW